MIPLLRRLRSVILASIAVGCGGAVAGYDGDAARPGLATAELSTPWSCPAPPGEVVREMTTRGEDQSDGNGVRTAGQTTEAAAMARRLYESKRWPQAIDLLKRVARGDTGDDAGNRDIAQFNLAKALFMTGEYEQAAATFRAMAHDARHLRHQETLLWIAKMSTEPRASCSFVPSDLASYTAQDVAAFDTREQRDLYWQLSYMLGVERVWEGNVTEARLLFKNVSGRSPYYNRALHCLLVE